jgi:hypothetical protein
MRADARRLRLGAVALALGSVLLMGADGDLQRCASMEDPAARLACYDAAQQQPGAEPASPAPEAAAPAPAAPAPAAGKADDRFGLPEAGTASITARIDGKFVEWKHGTRIRLDNGQVWKVMDEKSAYYPRLPDNAEVEITRGMLGYKMEIKAIKRSIYVRRVS